MKHTETTEKPQQRVYSSHQETKDTISPYLVVCSGLYGVGDSSFPQGPSLMRQLEQILPQWSLPVGFSPVELGSQMFASSKQLCQDGGLTDPAEPPHLHAVVGGNACTRAEELRSRDGMGHVRSASPFSLPVPLRRREEWDSLAWTSPVPQSTNLRLTFTHACSEPNQAHSQSVLAFNPLLLSEASAG